MPLTTRRTPWRITGLASGLALLALAAAAAALPYRFTHFGNFQHMMHTGDTGGQVKLSDVPQTPGTWGLGATAGLKGEILVWDGRVLVTPGSDPAGRAVPAAPTDQAVLFASATVTAWTDVTLPHDMDQAAVEAFVTEQARVRGIDTGLPFAFLIDGQFPQLRWHVVTGEKPIGQRGHGGHGGHAGGHGAGHANAASAMREFHAPGASGRLVGIYSGRALVGVVTHPGERFHVHYADANATVSGHVDAYAVAAGAVLKLPAR